MRITIFWSSDWKGFVMRDLKVFTGHRVIVSSDGSTLRGVLESATRSFVALTAAENVESPEPSPISGSVLIPVGRIRYVQVVS